MTVSEAGQKALKFILSELDAGVFILPREVYLQTIAEAQGITTQNIGSAYDDYIKKPLELKGIGSKKCGSRVRIQLWRIDSPR